MILGTGDVASRLVSQYAHRVQWIGLARDPQKLESLVQFNLQRVTGDLDRPASLHRLAGLADAVVMLAPPNPDRPGDPRSPAAIAALSMGSILPKRLVYVSTTGVYGSQQGAWVSETTPPTPVTSRAAKRVLAERHWRRWARTRQVAAVVLRAPGIYAADRLPAERVAAGTPVLLAEEDVFTHHIHADDLARMIFLALFRSAVAGRHGFRGGRVYNTVDQSQLKMGDYMDQVADYLSLPRPPRATRAVVKAAVTPMAYSFMSESRRISNARLLNECPNALRYPTVGHALGKNRKN